MPGQSRIASRYRPAAPSSAVARPHLFERLEEGSGRQLTLVTGPAGSGKTTLLTTWLEARSAPELVAWLAVEPSHGRPGRLWGELLTLIREAAGPVADTLGEVSETVDDEFIATVAAAADALPETVLVVLDDFERLRSRAALESLQAFLSIPQRRLRLVIAGRRDPYLPLQRLRLAEQLTELRGRDLAFSDREAGELFARSGIELDAAQVARLQRRTEGWVGGLRLAALSLQGCTDPDDLIERFTGDDHTVADYLVEEVLRRQPPPVREFMLKTSVVDTLEPDLADALTGHPGSAAALTLLERSNAFLVAIDQRRQRFRYHPMIQALLRSELRYRMPDAYALEHRLAARWFATHELPALAVKHAIAGDDTATATGLLLRHWPSIAFDGDDALLRAWTERLGVGAPGDRPELEVVAAAAALAAGDRRAGERGLQLADRRAADLTPERRAEYARSRELAAMLLARIDGDLAGLAGAARRALAAAELPRVTRGVRALALLHLGLAAHWSGELDTAAERFEEALAVARGEHLWLLALDCLGALALLRVHQGRLRAAEADGRAALRLALERGWEQRPEAAAAQLALGLVKLNRGELTAAAAQLERAAAAARRGAQRVPASLAAMARAVALGPGDPAEAVRAARAVRRDVEQLPLPFLAPAMKLCEASLHADAGDLDGAARALARCAEEERSRCGEAVIEARVRLASGNVPEALEVLRPLLAADGGQDEELGWIGPCTATRIEALALGSLAAQLAHDDRAALSLLERALALAEPEAIRLPLLRLGPPLRELLRRRVRAGTRHRALAAALLELLEHGDHAELTPPRVLLDPLSEREQAVLRYLPTVMSKAEIASELFVSVNTVKTHTQSIYRKLGVGTRTDAVRRARQLSLM